MTMVQSASEKSKPLEQMTKLELEAKCKAQRFVLFKLHREMEEKDQEIARLNDLLNKFQRK